MLKVQYIWDYHTHFNITHMPIVSHIVHVHVTQVTCMSHSWNTVEYIYIVKIEEIVLYRRNLEWTSSGAQNSCFDLIRFHQLRIPCSTRSETDERNLMTMESHQICSNSAYGAEHKVAIHNKPSVPSVHTYGVTPFIHSPMYIGSYLIHIWVIRLIAPSVVWTVMGGCLAERSPQRLPQLKC